ncbi:MAG TPA: hypothetical protein VFQ80_00335 [Thermomicrobiales bacterium]|jgi:hypothetical protein|nr:hypothetical protein [Thermomicrobiales bacterium]
MAVMMQMFWPGIGIAEYEAARRRVNWEGDVPPGAKFHVMAVAADGVHVTDVWESQEQFERFAADRLMPATRELGFPGAPQVQFFPVHAIFAPAYASA